MFDGEPLWFPSDELLTSVLHAEINAVMQLLAKHPDLPSVFDSLDATVSQRNACFALLAHRKVIDTILDTLAGRYIQPSITHEESQSLRLTYNLVANDAPAWVLEMHRVVERLPAHIYTSLPEPLRMGCSTHVQIGQFRPLLSSIPSNRYRVGVYYCEKGTTPLPPSQRGWATGAFFFAQFWCNG